MKSEKISINLTPAELGQIDLIVERGLYDNRSDFLRTAAQKLIENHPAEIRQFLEPEHLKDDVFTRLMWGIGIFVMTKDEIENMVLRGTQVNIRTIGIFTFEKNITADEVKQVVRSCKVRGKIIASDEVKAALKEIE